MQKVGESEDGEELHVKEHGWAWGLLKPAHDPEKDKS